LPQITALFFDVGGVVLKNGWDRASRNEFAEKFQIDAVDFEDRHELLSGAFETGQLSLEHYLDRTLFYRERPFTKDQVRDFIFSRSERVPGTVALLERLARAGKYFLATLNNESRELNLYRIKQFNLRKYFSAFFSSCYLGVQKPEEAIYRLAMDITQRAPEECLFIDDRPLNVETACRLGMRGVRFHDAEQLEKELQGLGIDL